MSAHAVVFVTGALFAPPEELTGMLPAVSLNEALRQWMHLGPIEAFRLRTE